ncbi:MAG: magnesium transporter [Alphaproteobacteria bacterium]|nr:magnesium transporter [Alphaproteobacteria bacterium]MBV9373119.1 magnesium transporter [Alphaproteobacteria bacterium]MBV9902851.1 magnesium transporter [Alphaproteobacteria bacterium]
MSESDPEAPPLAAPGVPDTRLDKDDRLKPEFVREVIDHVEAGETETARALVEPLHPADIADLFELVDPDDRGKLAVALADVLDADVIAEMNEHVREALIDALDPRQVADIAGEMETDDAVAMIEDLEEDEQRAILRELDPDDRAAIEEALTYPEESAGRLMQRDLIAVPEHWTVGQVIDYLRAGDGLTTDFWEIFVVDPQHHPIGTCLLSWVLRAKREVAMADLMKREQTLIPVEMDQEEVALRFQKYALISAAVVDQSGRLVGMITVDDIVHIIQEEASEDVLLMSGAGDEGDINQPILDSYKARVRWLVVNLATALVPATVISLFGGAIEKMVVLAALMPIVAGVGGNAGTQTLAVTVRALATNQLTLSNRWRAVGREIRVALLNGLSVASVIGLAVGLWFLNPLLGGVIAAAMLTNIVVAGLAGALVPLTLERWGADPAVASSIFVTMTTDSMGFLLFLGIAVAVGVVG